MPRPPYKQKPPVQLTALFDKLPPNDIPSEMALLGSMLLDWRVIPEVTELIAGPDDFYRRQHGKIYSAMIKVHHQNQNLDLVMLHGVLEDHKVLEDVGGADYLVELGESVPSAANAAYYAQMVRDKAMLRGFAQAAAEGLHEVYHTADDPLELIGRQTEKLFDLRGRRDDAGLTTAAAVVKDTMAKIYEGREQGLDYGYLELDEMTSGLHEEEFVVIGARPSMGKTALACNIALNLCIRNDVQVMLFSLEMSRTQLMERLMCSFGGIHLEDVRKHPEIPMGPRSQELLTHAASSIADSGLIIDDTPKLSDSKLQARARKAVQDHGAKVIVIDYIQLMTSGARHESRQQELTAISAGLKALARQTKTTVIGLSQLKRAGTGSVERPRMSDLRESGSIEQDADVVALLHREEYYHKADAAWLDSNPDQRGKAELIIDKQRNGPTGVVPLRWDCTTGTFSSWGAAEEAPLQAGLGWRGWEEEAAEQAAVRM